MNEPSSEPSDTTASQTGVPLRARWSFDVSDAVPVDGRFQVAASLVVPAGLATGQEVTLLVCLPGGFLSRRYYDLEIEGSRRFSFAEAMAAAGFVTLAFDHVGTGDSSQPEPLELGYSIRVADVARANQHALVAARARLASGDAAVGLPPLHVGRSVGVGHSMGSLLTVQQQADAKPHDGLVLFSFGTHGTPRFLDDHMRAYADEPARLAGEVGELARRAMGSPYPQRANDSEENRRAAFGVGTAPADAEEALHLAATNLLAVGGLTSMIPGGFAPAAEQIDVPVLMAYGDHDLHDARHTREELPRVRDLTIFELEDAWHCHFVANTRERLWRAVSDWIHAHA